jgi:hypothetical protein
MHVLAYIDPGTGSLFLQLLTGTVLGALFTFRRCLNRAKGLLSKRK